jgi:hypothetical protein
MTDLPKCPKCGCDAVTTVRGRGDINYGTAQIRCANGCHGMHVGFSFAPGHQAAARQELEEKWKQLVEGKPQ